LSHASPEETRARLHLPGVRAPKPLLSPEALRRLTARQWELLDELNELVVAEGLADLTMAQIAARVNCSLRTLYGIAPSKDELVLAVVDRRLHRIGRRAIGSLDPSLPPLEVLRSYLRAVNEAVQPETSSFSRDFANTPGARRLLDSHEDYVIAVTRSLLERAVAEGDAPPVDTAALAHVLGTAALAHVLGGLGREFSRPELAELAADSPKATADAIADIVLRGLGLGDVG
jgi:AcrR family transcriptional regulator